MTRKKVKLLWIASDNARKASFKKRRLGLLKKVCELTTLCDTFAFAVINGPDENHHVIWPSLSAGQHFVTFSAFWKRTPEKNDESRDISQGTRHQSSTYAKETHQEELRTRTRSSDASIASRSSNIPQLTNRELLTLFWMIGERIRDCQKRIEYHQQVHRLPPIPTEFVPSNSTLFEIGSKEIDHVDNGKNLIDQWFIDIVMNSNDKHGGSSSSMAGEIGFVQSEVNMGDLMNGGNSMVGIDKLGRMKTIIVEGDGDENILLSEWNFGVNDNSGMSEIEELVNNINVVGIEAAISLMDFTHQVGYGIGGDVNGGDLIGSLYSDGCYYGGGGGGVGIDVNDDAEMLVQGLFECGISCNNGNGNGTKIQNGNGNGNENQNKEGEGVEYDLLSKGWQKNFTT